MAAATLDKQITSYLGLLNTSQKKAVLTVVKTFAEDQPAVNTWNDEKSFITEMDKRFSELESGKIKGLTLDELEANARLAFKTRKKK